MFVAHRLVPILAAATLIAILSLSESDAAETKSKTTSKTAAKKAPAKTATKTAAKTAPKASAKAPAKKGTASSSAASKKGAPAKKSAKRVQRAPARPRGQQQPTPDRYKEIQQALSARGMLNSEPTGTWGQESTDALRRFQAQQNLQPTGKLDSLTIIALGLGPKHSATAQVRPNNENRSPEGSQRP